MFKPISNEESAPNAFEGANSVILSPDRRFLFATNGGDNSVISARQRYFYRLDKDRAWQPEANRINSQ